MKRLNYIVALAAALLLVANNAWAGDPTEATETQSVGTSNLQVDVPELYFISGIDDLHITSTDVSAWLLDGTSGETTQQTSQSDSVCIYTNRNDTDYKIRLAGSSTCTGGTCGGGFGATKFYVAEDTTNHQAIPYRPSWTANSTHDFASANWTKGGAAATSGSAYSGATHSFDLSCSGSKQASFGISFTAQDVLAVKTGTYTGVLTITLLPPT